MSTERLQTIIRWDELYGGQVPSSNHSLMLLFLRKLKTLKNIKSDILGWVFTARLTKFQKGLNWIFTLHGEKVVYLTSFS